MTMYLPSVQNDLRKLEINDRLDALAALDKLDTSGQAHPNVRTIQPEPPLFVLRDGKFRVFFVKRNDGEIVVIAVATETDIEKTIDVVLSRPHDALR